MENLQKKPNTTTQNKREEKGGKRLERSNTKVTE